MEKEEVLQSIYEKLGRAYARETGCRLSAEEVDTLLLLDHGVATAVEKVFDMKVDDIRSNSPTAAQVTAAL